METSKFFLASNNMRLSLISALLFIFACVNIKAQEIQSSHVKVAPHPVITKEMEEEIVNDTIGKYRVGVGPKKALDIVNKKENVTNDIGQKNANFNPCLPAYIPPTPPLKDQSFKKSKK